MVVDTKMWVSNPAASGFIKTGKPIALHFQVLVLQGVAAMSFSIRESREMSHSVFHADEFVRSLETSLTADLCMQMHAYTYMNCPALLL